jgi:hypothetical protein
VLLAEENNLEIFLFDLRYLLLVLILSLERKIKINLRLGFTIYYDYDVFYYADILKAFTMWKRVRYDTPTSKELEVK